MYLTTYLILRWRIDIHHLPLGNSVLGNVNIQINLSSGMLLYLMSIMFEMCQQKYQILMSEYQVPHEFEYPYINDLSLFTRTA